MYQTTAVTETGAVITCTHKSRAMAIAEIVSALVPDISALEMIPSKNHILIFIDKHYVNSVHVTRLQPQPQENQQQLQPQPQCQ